MKKTNIFRKKKYNESSDKLSNTKYQISFLFCKSILFQNN